MTYSIVARDPETGHFGVAVTSRFFAAGAIVPHLRPGKCAVASQSYVNPVAGHEAADRIAAGEAPDAVLADIVARDTGEARRQIHMVDHGNRIAQHTGAECIDWCGHVSGPGISVAGNMLSGPEVVADALAAYLDNPALPLADRLLTAMEAGEAAGGDKRGRQSAGLIVNRGEIYNWLDIRADDHESPLGELRRLLEVADEMYFTVADFLPSATNPTGITDVEALNAAVEANTERRAALGKASRSRAWTRPE